MSLFLPDVNVWLALSDEGHMHNPGAWYWKSYLSADAKLIFCRHTQIGLLRLLTNPAVMGRAVVTLNKAWHVYGLWLEDPAVEFYPEPRTIDTEFRRATQPFSSKNASKWIGDCWLLAFAQSMQASLITYDRALYEFAHKQGNRAIMPSSRKPNL